ncbi:hypothetical protein BRADI_3g14785v3 [Brachypodium distachyon]|uniref:Endonuclease/exonuclease/phosphatase domain-containing protein n=1 Tax=Brachypodium distachyon TaxID=15368 RepID=A0A2K2CX56_BRADI|nr:hypothetical protein BRADI_3g14785v3 [Brachypodium distachyon]
MLTPIPDARQSQMLLPPPHALPRPVFRPCNSSCSSTRLLFWNVQGLNSPARCASVRALVSDARDTVVCLQETKLQFVSRSDVFNLLGGDFADNFGFLLADGTRGGILLAASDRFFSLSNFTTTANTISASITWREDGSSWTLTEVYGPQGEA